jgi:hypothetical protein
MAEALALSTPSRPAISIWAGGDIHGQLNGCGRVVGGHLCHLAFSSAVFGGRTFSLTSD